MLDRKPFVVQGSGQEQPAAASFSSGTVGHRNQWFYYMPVEMPMVNCGFQAKTVGIVAASVIIQSRPHRTRLGQWTKNSQRCFAAIDDECHGYYYGL